MAVASGIRDVYLSSLVQRVAASKHFKAGLQLLDYGKAAIQMRAATQEEYVFRCLACEKEPWTVEWIEGMPPGSVFYDVGASTGPYSLVAGSRGIRTFAFEPGITSYARLWEHVGLNDMTATVTPLPMALSSRTGLGTMQHLTTIVGMASARFNPDGIMPDITVKHDNMAQTVIMFRMDDLTKFDPAIQRPTHIKLDVDGAEAEVLKGAAVAVSRPEFDSLMLELHGKDEAGLMALTAELGLALVRKWDRHVDNHPVQGANGVAYGLFRKAVC
jgi:FkbM family methyltransferase